MKKEQSLKQKVRFIFRFATTYQLIERNMPCIRLLARQPLVYYSL